MPIDPAGTQPTINDQPVLTDGALVEGFDSALETANVDQRNTPVVSASANTQLVASGGNPNPLMPDVWAYGISTGAAIPQPWKGAGFILSPTGNPADFTTADGTPANILFASKPLTVGRLNPNAVFGRGLVATYNTGTGVWEPGYGGSVVINAASVPVLVWLNSRVDPSQLQNFTGTVSANLGVAVSLDQVGARALAGTSAGLAGITALLPNPVTAGGATATGTAAAWLTAAGQGANAFVGGGYRVELKFENGRLDGIYYKGNEIIDLHDFAISAAQNQRQRYQPPVIPNQGNPQIANYNSTVQQIFGTSPWDLAAVSGGANHGNGAVAVANAWRSAIQTYGQHYYNQLPREVQSIVVLGPRSMSDAGSAINAILNVADPQTASRIISQLENRYNLDFGVPAVKFANEIDLFPETRPGDYQFVRNVFEGDYRYFEDNPRGFLN